MFANIWMLNIDDDLKKNDERVEMGCEEEEFFVRLCVCRRMTKTSNERNVVADDDKELFDKWDVFVCSFADFRTHRICCQCDQKKIAKFL